MTSTSERSGGLTSAADRLSRYQAGRSNPFESALTPKERYISKEWLALEYERLWPRVWQMACRLEEIPQVGDFLEYTVGKDSILLVRTAPDSVKGFYNACLHRGTRLCAGTGNVGLHLLCRYHAWSWNLDGSIREVTDADDFAPECMRRAELQLPEVQVGTWGGFVFINMAENPEPLHEFLAPVIKYYAPYEVDKMRLLRYRSTILDCNWKVGVDGFNEAYHVEGTHVWDLSGMAARQASTNQPSLWEYSKHIFRDGIVDVRDAQGRTPGAYQFFYETFGETHNLQQHLPDILRGAGRLSDLENPRETAIRMLQTAITIGLAHQDEVEYVRNLSELDLDMEMWQFLIEVRRKVGQAQGIDYSHISDEELMSDIDFCIYPNLVGPVRAGNWILFRFRPNGDDPNTCIYDVMFLHRYPENDEPTPVEHEWYPDWRDHDDWGATILQDISNFGHVQAGMHQRSFKGVRLGYQEIGLRHFAKFIDRYVNS